MYLEKKFHKYSVVIFDLLINNRFLKNQECVFINFDLWQKKDFVLWWQRLPTSDDEQKPSKTKIN